MKLQDATACELVLWLGSKPLIVAKGMVHPAADKVHNEQLLPGHAAVQIDNVVEGWEHVPLPVQRPENGMLYVEDARLSFVQWPKNQIILDQVMHK